jgi:molybdopterin-containing oxidoreductase family iron-sulfur binding subunit
MGENGHRPIIWSTLDEYELSPEVLARQGKGDFNTKPKGFLENAADTLGVTDLAETAVQRRTFLKMGGFAAVLAGLTGCQKPLEQIIPYVNAPEEVIPGLPTYYASTCRGCEAGCATIVKTRLSRPIKLDGNAASPVNQGAMCSRGQASLLELYDPDRYRRPQDRRTQAGADWDPLDQEISTALRNAGDRAVLVTSTVHGPARVALLEEFKRTFPGLQHVVYDDLSDDERAESNAACYGEALVPRVHFDKSECTVLLGADPIAEGASSVEFNRGIATQRKLRAVGPGKKEGQNKYSMGKLIAFEPMISLTGMNADEHYAVRPDDLFDVTCALAQAIRDSGNASVREVVIPPVNIEDVERNAGLKAGTIASVAADLLAHKGKSLVYVGSVMASTDQALAMHVIANQINSMLENDGSTIVAEAPSSQRQGSRRAMLGLVERMKAGQVDVLLLEGCNPAYSLPSSAGFAEAAKQVRLKVSFGLLDSETTALCDVVLPGLHFLENWGDAEPYAGILSIQQPTIQALWNNRSFEASLITLARLAGSKSFDVSEAVEGAEEPVTRAMTWHEYLRQTWQTQIHDTGNFAGGFQEFWFSLLRRGTLEVPDRAKGPRGPRTLRRQGIETALNATPRSARPSGTVLASYVNSNTFDGRHANNPWLFELPDPVAKVSWDNFAAVAPKFARANGLRDGDIIRLTANNQSVEAPVRIHPGMHPDAIGVAVGWGRSVSGDVGAGVGFNAYDLSAAKENQLVRSGSAVSWEKTGRRIRIADMQGNNYMLTFKQENPEGPLTSERQIVMATSLDTLNEDNKNPQPYYHIPYRKVGDGKAPWDLWESSLTSREPEMKPFRHKWVMTIDLNSCTGCNACVTACQAQNNVPVVGKREVLRGREMHWIRIDRYYKGEPDNPEVVKMPMLCQHCDNAPCETVCPVLATVHNDEGINQQVYNRCVGTRYCANNCPYKIRRFNFFQYSDYRQSPHVPNNDTIRDTPLVLMLNPDISVRTRGIMEKCTFCQERIRDAKYEAKKLGRNVPNGSLKTACQQTCPAQAIEFGDALNREHDVNVVRADNYEKRGYGVLQEFNVAPNVMYLAHVWNREKKDWDHSYTETASHGHHDDGHHDEIEEHHDHDHATPAATSEPLAEGVTP